MVSHGIGKADEPIWDFVDFMAPLSITCKVQFLDTEVLQRGLCVSSKREFQVYHGLKSAVWYLLLFTCNSTCVSRFRQVQYMEIWIF